MGSWRWFSLDMADSKIRLLIVDDHPVVRRGLSDLFARAEDIEVVGTAADGVEAVTLSLKQNPDIVLMDLSMPNMDGMEATRFLLRSCPDARVVMLTSFSGKERVKEALRSGAVGYLLKDAPTEELINGVRTAARSSHRLADI
jgi:DNA-binding NarL/FixJ family response regulator